MLNRVECSSPLLPHDCSENPWGLLFRISATLSILSHVSIALGSNISSEENLRAAAEQLRKLWPGIRFSSVYKTAARELEDQPDFLNAVARFATEMSLQEIYDHLHTIERDLKKTPSHRYGPRTIDLDILLIDEIVQNESTSKRINELTLPHPRMHERRFVLEPLCELMDRAGKHPVLGESWADLLSKTADQRVDRTDIVL